MGPARFHCAKLNSREAETCNDTGQVIDGSDELLMYTKQVLPTFPPGVPPYDSHFHLCLLGVQSPHPGYPSVHQRGARGTCNCHWAFLQSHVTVTVPIPGVPGVHQRGARGTCNCHSVSQRGYPVCTSAVQEAHVTVTVTGVPVVTVTVTA